MSGHLTEPQFLAIRGNPDTEQLQEWWRNQRGTKEFLAQLEDELFVRAAERVPVREIGPPMVHLVMDEWPGGPPGEFAICGAGRATKVPPNGEPTSCVVCLEMARRWGYDR